MLRLRTVTEEDYAEEKLLSLIPHKIFTVLILVQQVRLE